MASIVATASYSGVESNTRLAPTSPAAEAASTLAAKMRRGSSDAARRARMSSKRRVGEPLPGPALISAHPGRVAPTGIESETLHRLAIREALEALQHHHGSLSPPAGWTAAAPLPAEQICEQLVGEKPAAVASGAEASADIVRS